MGAGLHLLLIALALAGGATAPDPQTKGTGTTGAATVTGTTGASTATAASGQTTQPPQPTTSKAPSDGISCYCTKETVAAAYANNTDSWDDCGKTTFTSCATMTLNSTSYDKPVVIRSGISVIKCIENPPTFDNYTNPLHKYNNSQPETINGTMSMHCCTTDHCNSSANLGTSTLLLCCASILALLYRHSS